MLSTSAFLPHIPKSGTTPQTWHDGGGGGGGGDGGGGGGGGGGGDDDGGGDGGGGNGGDGGDGDGGGDDGDGGGIVAVAVVVLKAAFSDCPITQLPTHARKN